MIHMMIRHDKLLKTVQQVKGLENRSANHNALKKYGLKRRKFRRIAQ